MQLAPNGGYSLQSEPLLAGDDGTAQTVRKIRELVHQGKNDPRVNHATGTILRSAGVRSHDRIGELRAIFHWVLRNIRFTQDPTGAECLRPAATTIEWGFGDCDDINAILLPSMLKTVGFEVRLVTIAAHPSAPEQFSHVYCEAYLKGRWIPIDAARPDAKFGVAAPHSFRHRRWSLDSDSFEDLRGLSCAADCECSMRMTRRRTLGTHMRLGRLGQDGFDWGAFANVIQSAGAATSSIVRAAQAPSVVFPSAPGYPSPVPYGTAPSVLPGGGVSAVGSISGNTLLLLGAAFFGIVLLSRR
jgi:hypothetical protein